MIYADSFLVFNFLIDYAALKLTSKITVSHFCRKRAIAASLAGAIFALLNLSFGNLLWIISAGAFPFLICLIAFDFVCRKQYFVSVAVFWGVSIFTGGIITAFSSLFSGLVISSRIYILLIIAGVSIIYLLFALYKRTIGARLSSPVRNVTLDYNNGKYYSALVDSGNLLVNPENGLPVVIFSSKCSTIIKNSCDNRQIFASGRSLYILFDSCNISVNNGRKMRNVTAAVAYDPTVTDFGGCDCLLPLSAS